MEENVKKKKPRHILEQIKWREKQLKIYYYSGRPIHKTVIEKNHMYYTNELNHVKGFYQ